MATIENKNKFDVTWQRNDWAIGDAITEPKMDSIENGLYILMNEVYGERFTERLAAIESELGGVPTPSGFSNSRLDGAVADAVYGRQAGEVVGSSGVVDMDMAILEQLKNQQNTINQLMKLVEQNNTVSKSYFVRWPLCCMSHSEWDANEHATAQSGIYTFDTQGADRNTFPVYARFHAFSVYTYINEVAQEYTITESDGVYSCAISTFNVILNRIIAQFSDPHVLRFSFRFHFTHPDAALHFVYKYDPDGAMLRDLNYYQRPTSEWYPVTFISAMLDNRPLDVSGVGELTYGKYTDIEFSDLAVEACDYYDSSLIGADYATRSAWLTGKDVWFMETPEPFSAATLNLNDSTFTITKKNNVELSVPKVYNIQWAPAVAKQGFRDIPVKTIINSIS